MANPYAVERIHLGAIDLVSGAVDPSAGAGVVAPVGSMYYRTDGDQFIKIGAGDTEWMSTNAVNSNLFGDGSDGDLSVLAGTTTEASTIGDVYYNDGTIALGAVYQPAGRRIWFNGTLTIAGTWDCNGNAAAGAVGGAALAASLLIGGTAGGAGGSFGAGAAGGNLATHPGYPPSPNGAGGAGGAGNGGAGGIAGVYSAGYSSTVGETRSSLQAWAAAFLSGLSQNGIGGGLGGGGGGGNGAANAGGGAGGGARTSLCIARKIVLTGTMRTNGGAGAAGAGVNAGGGGGGGAAPNIAVVRDLVGAGTRTATGGAGGASGGGAGVAGAAGTDNVALALRI